MKWQKWRATGKSWPWGVKGNGEGLIKCPCRGWGWSPDSVRESKPWLTRLCDYTPGLHLGMSLERRTQLVRPTVLSNRLACTLVQMGSGVPFRGARLTQNTFTPTVNAINPWNKCGNAIISFSFSPGNSRPTSPKSDSELIGKPSNTDNQNPEMHWAWGELPQAAMVGKP